MEVITTILNYQNNEKSEQVRNEVGNHSYENSCNI